MDELKGKPRDGALFLDQSAQVDPSQYAGDGKAEEAAEILVQGSLNQDITDDFPVDPGVRTETANYPVIQARCAFVWHHSECEGDATTVGISGHYGETGFDFLEPGPPPLNLPPLHNVRVKTWSFNVDFEVPLTSHTTVRGEYFRGANLSPFLGGIGRLS